MVFTKIGPNYLEATMPVDHRTRQPMGILHGGASAALAETMGSIASVMCLIDPLQYDILGLEVQSNHVRSAREQFVTGKVTPIHLGRTLHLWNIQMLDHHHKLCCDSKLTVIIRKKS
ncbi:UNVERIFIED_CONTAM: hypothetical protein GTU68_047997 [Idotea baltica]|nr:hypothetical protein [Idotea baltica]